MAKSQIQGMLPKAKSVAQRTCIIINCVKLQIPMDLSDSVTSGYKCGNDNAILNCF